MKGTCANWILSVDRKAQAFLEAMYSNNIILDNFTLKVYSYHFNDKDEFIKITGSASIFRGMISSIISNICTDKFGNQEKCERRSRKIYDLYIEEFSSGFLGSYAFALWFMHFDGDNWFSFDAVHEQARQYLDSTELRLFKGFDNDGMLTMPVTVLDLPVVINYEEKTVSIWTGELND